MSSPPHAVGWALAGLLLNALVWGLSWWPFKQLHTLGLHPLWSTALVYGLSFVTIVLWTLGRGKRLDGWQAHPGLWLLLLASGLTNIGFNWAVTIGDVVRVVLLFYLMPAWSVPVAWLLLGEKPDRRGLLRVLLALMGVVIVLKQPDTPWPIPESLADWLALLGGLSFAITNALLFKLKNSPETARMLAMFGGGTLMGGLAASLGTACGVISSVVGPPPMAWPWVVILTLGFLGGNLGLQYGAARLSAHTTALVMLSEILFASASYAILGASSWDGRTLVGGALILLAALLSVIMRTPKPAHDE